MGNQYAVIEPIFHNVHGF